MLLRVVAVLALSASAGAPLAELLFSTEHDCCAAPCPGEEESESRPLDGCFCCALGTAAIAVTCTEAIRPAVSQRLSMIDPLAPGEHRAFVAGVYRPPRG